MWGCHTFGGLKTTLEGVFFSSTKWVLKAELRLAGKLTH